MRSGSARLSAFVGFLIGASLVGVCSGRAQDAHQMAATFSQQLHPTKKLPTDVILVKGAWSSASDS